VKFLTELPSGFAQSPSPLHRGRGDSLLNLLFTDHCLASNKCAGL
jgi:hypothetical protein